MALQSAEQVAGLVLMSGYYYPTPRAEAIRVPAAAFPFVRRLMAPDTMRRVFAPCAVPERFKRTYPMPLAMRMSQMRAVDEEAAMLPGAAKAFCQLYRELSVPVCLIAGSEDRIVDTDRAFRCVCTGTSPPASSRVLPGADTWFITPLRSRCWRRSLLSAHTNAPKMTSQRSTQRTDAELASGCALVISPPPKVRFTVRPPRIG